MLAILQALGLMKIATAVAGVTFATAMVAGVVVTPVAAPGGSGGSGTTSGSAP